MDPTEQATSVRYPLRTWESAQHVARTKRVTSFCTEPTARNIVTPTKGWRQMYRSFKQYLADKEREYGSMFDPSQLVTTFVPHFESGQRIIVVTEWDDGQKSDERRGYVGITTGWRPAFLLVNNTRSMGSSDVLGPNDRIVGTVDKYR